MSFWKVCWLSLLAYRNTFLRTWLSLLLVGSTAFGSAYNANPPSTLNSGETITVWSAETPTPGTGNAAASQQVALVVKNGRAGSPFGVDGKFSAAPGAFEVDVQVASIDADANYQTISGGNITTVDSTNQTFHLDAPGVTAKFVRLLLRTRGNSVSLTASVTGG